MTGKKDIMDFEDWKKEPTKILLERKLSEVTRILGGCYQTPTEDYLRLLYGAVSDYITFLPLPIFSEKQRDQFTEVLDEIGLIIYGTDSEQVQALMKKYKVAKRYYRKGRDNVEVIVDIPNLINALRNVLIKAGNFATSKGLRTTLSSKQDTGMERIIKEEGFEDLDLTGPDGKKIEFGED